MNSPRSAQHKPVEDWAGCEAEPIHVPGSIQPYGLLLVFDSGTGLLRQWAGDCEGLLGRAPGPGVSMDDVLGRRHSQLIGRLPLARDREPVTIGPLVVGAGVEVSLAIHRSGTSVVVEVERHRGSGSPLEMLELGRSITDSIARSAGLDQACSSAAAHVRRLTGFDRVMVYRFNEDGSGSVVAEALAPAAVSFLHHRFPESDIPAQARELYRRNLLRAIPDAGYSPLPLQPAGAGQPLDMSQCSLRSVSPVHLQYLKNMGVAASMSVSVVLDGELWGLIACHHMSPLNVPVEARLLCRHVGTSLAAFIRSDTVAEAARARALHSAALEDLLTLLRSSDDPERELRSSAEQLMSLVECSGIAFVGNGVRIASAGRVPDERATLKLAAIVGKALEDEQVFATDRLGADHPQFTPIAADASGVMAVSINGWRPLILLWFREEQVEEIRWAGLPWKDEGPGLGKGKPLTPRRSFATWRETVNGRSRPWAAAEVTAAGLFGSRAGLILQGHRVQRTNRSLEQANARLNALATTDPLTGLPNRRYFMKRLAAEWKRSLREGAPIGFVAIDIDKFKDYNDRFGHPAGDDCLRKVADALQEARRSGDVAARVGGEEFALLLPMTGREAAAAVAERVRSAVEALGVEHPLNAAGVVTVSLGVAAGPPGRWGEPMSLAKAADEELYKAKSGGRNRLSVAAMDKN